MKHTVDSAIVSLKMKGVNFDDLHRYSLIDISGARSLGNGSWGKLDYLCKTLRAVVVGRKKYKQQFN